MLTAGPHFVVIMSRISQLLLVALCFILSILPSTFADDDPSTVTSENRADYSSSY